jgi:hypothetical protein
LCFLALLWEVIVVFAFDTLGYSKRLREADVPQNHAEAHAEAARDFIMTELATRADLLATKSELMAIIETQTLRLTVRLGSMIIAGIGVLAFLIRTH